MQSILVIEDCVDFSDAVKSVLKQNYVVKSATSLTLAKEMIESEKFDLFILDLSLPDGNGFQFCSYLKSNEFTRTSPILAMSGNTDNDARVSILDLGADDFLLKPFYMAEFCARVRARLRNSIHGFGANSVGPFWIETKSHKIFLVENNVKKDLNLTPLEFRLLLSFLEKNGHALTREQLISFCHGLNYHASNRAVDLHVHSLRKKLGRFGDCIKTLYGTGYLMDLDCA